jgi:hypothetical protein
MVKKNWAKLEKKRQKSLAVTLQTIGLNYRGSGSQIINMDDVCFFVYFLFTLCLLIQAPFLQRDKDPAPPLPSLTHDQRIRDHIQKVRAARNERSK